MVEQDGKWDVYLRNGDEWELKILIVYEQIEEPAPGFLSVYTSFNSRLFGGDEENEILLYKEDGSRLTEEVYSKVEFFSEGTSETVAMVGNPPENERYGLMDTEGCMIFPVTYEKVDVHGKIVVLKEQDGKLHLYDTQRNSLSQTSYDAVNLAEDLDAPSTVIINGKSGYWSGDGRVSIPPVYGHCLSLIYDKNAQLFPIEQGGKWGYLDTKGNIVLDFAYSQVTVFRNGLDYVAKYGKMGIINEDSETVLPFFFDEISPISPVRSRTNGTTLVVQKDGKYGYIAITP